MSGSSSRTHFSSSSFSFQSTDRPFIRSLIIAQRCSNSATFTGCSPTTRRDESPRPMPITIRPSEMSCIVAYQLAVIVGSRTARVVGPGVLESVLLCELHQLDHPLVRRVRQHGHAKAEHRHSPIAGRGTSI